MDGVAGGEFRGDLIFIGVGFLSRVDEMLIRRKRVWVGAIRSRIGDDSVAGYRPV
jgi:hypothetical protein